MTRWQGLSLPEAARTGLSVEGSMGPEANIIVVPFLKLVLKQMDVVGDAVLAEQLVKLQWKLDWNSTPLSVWIMSTLMARDLVH